jgi:AcrR family transcriptional regulator
MTQTPGSPLPRGPHQLSREQVAESQRTRLMRAFTVLLAERGYSAVTVGELARVASVSRGAFYEHFADKQECLFAAYDRFSLELLSSMTVELGIDLSWPEFVRAALNAYLDGLERDRVAARAFLVQMDGAGPEARERRRALANTMAQALHARYEEFRRQDPTLGPLPVRVFLGLAFAVRELISEALERDESAPLSVVAPDIFTWIAATVQGTRAVGA